VVLWNGSHVQAKLVAIHASPDESLAILCNCNGVVLPAIYMSDAVILEIKFLYKSRSIDGSIVIASALADPTAPETIDPPGPQTIFFINSKRVVGAGIDGFVHFRLRTQGVRLEACLLVHCASTLNDVVTKLVLLSRSPNKDCTLFVHGHGMVSAADDVNYVLELRNKNRCGLDLDFCSWPEAENTVGFLKNLGQLKFKSYGH